MKRTIFLISLVMMLSVFSVMAPDQSTQGTVNADLSLIPTPNPLVFGATIPGTPTAPVEITLTPGTSNLAVTVSLNGGASGLFNNIKFDVDDDGTYSPAAGVINVDANTPLSFNSRLDVPVGFASGSYIDGVITYIAAERFLP